MTTGIEQLTSQLSSKLPFIKVDASSDIPALIVSPEHLVEVMQLLATDPEYGFTFLTDLCGVHYPDQPLQLGVVYLLHNMVKNVRLRVKCFVSDSNPVIPSLTPLFESANWMERETYDFYGIRFEGHPNLIRILNMDEMVEFPMRKEYRLEDATRTDKEDSYFGR